MQSGNGPRVCVAAIDSFRLGREARSRVCAKRVESATSTLLALSISATTVPHPRARQNSAMIVVRAQHLEPDDATSPAISVSCSGSPASIHSTDVLHQLARREGSGLGSQVTSSARSTIAVEVRRIFLARRKNGLARIVQALSGAYYAILGSTRNISLHSGQAL